MSGKTRVDLHCHSVVSDGSLTPALLAEALARDNVAVASLVDHDTLEGLVDFQNALARHEISLINGVEITARFRENDVHILAYGFDPSHSGLISVLHSVRRKNSHEHHSISGSLRDRAPETDESEDSLSASNGWITVEDAIALVHRAGGRAFLAHPLFLENDLASLEEIVVELRQKGLDGIEAIYARFSEEEQAALCEMADRHGLLVSGGTDFHELGAQSSSSLGVDMPEKYWKEFRDAVCSGYCRTPNEKTVTTCHSPKSGFDWRSFVFHFVFPTFLAIGLFVTAIYAIFLPTFESSLMERKREMIRELTNSAWSILNGYYEDAEEGKISQSEAKEEAKRKIGMLRYGEEGKDYFWLQDLQPKMIMHPYRTDLNGKDLSDFTDARGDRIFVQFANLVKKGRSGYVEYVWQWKDDPSRIEPKESYIKEFEPWRWIIGTGMYVEDVEREISRIERSLVLISVAITIIVILLLLYVMRESLKLERDRASAEAGLFESTERYRSLVEATTEGALLVVGGRLRYANPTFLEMIGARAEELELLDLADIIPETEENETAWDILHRMLSGEDATDGFDAVVRRRDARLIECVIVTSRISFAEKSGFILLARLVTPSQGPSAHQRNELQKAAYRVPVGIFRARATSRGAFTEYNERARVLLNLSDTNESMQHTLVDVFEDPKDFYAFVQELKEHSQATRKLTVTTNEPSTRTLLITANMDYDEQGNAKHIDGAVEDITATEKSLTDLREVVEKLQSSMLFLHEPISQVGKISAFCNLDTPISQVTHMMTDQQASAALVRSESGDVIGIVTDEDIRKRVVATGLDPGDQVHKIMSSPLATIQDRREIYEALILMERKGIQHIAVTDESGEVTGVICNRDLLQFKSYGLAVISREVERSQTCEEVARHCRRVPGLAKALLTSGAQPQHLTNMVSSICDAAAVKFINIAQDELGPAPVPFAFLAMGSHGRSEMTLASDQDNAIVYSLQNTPASSSEEIREYMQKLGTFVCDWLAESGYPLCPGNIMAKNPEWCQPVEKWKEYFTSWISLPEPQQLMDFNIFFDFRTVYGNENLAKELRKHIYDAAKDHPPFYAHLASSSLQFKPPARLFGLLIGGSAPKDQSGMLDLKDALMPIVSFSRLYALRQMLDETNTTDRLDLLCQQKVLKETSCEEIYFAYEFLMRIRLTHQAEAIGAGREADNTINYRNLRQSEHTLLNQSFAQINAIQKKISYDFLGGTV